MELRLPTLDFVIATYNRPKSLMKLLESLNRQILCDFDFKVYIVDDGSGCDYIIPSLRFAVKTFLRKRGDGPCVYSCRNLAFGEGSGDVVVYLDDDLTLEPTLVYLTQLYHWKNERLILVPYLLDYRCGGVQFDGWGKGIDSMPGNVWTSGGCGMSVRRKWLKAVGGYDESFDGSMGFADVELKHRLFLELDLDCWHVPGIGVYLDDRETGSHRAKVIEDWREKHPGEVDINYQKLLKKWPDWKKVRG